MASISVRPSANSHDCWSYVGYGTNYTDVSFLYGGEGVTGLEMRIGIFLGSINITKDSTINSATLSAAGGTTGSPPDKLQVYADDQDDVAVWDTSTQRPSVITKTTAKSKMNTSTFDTDVKAHIEELTSRGGWSSGNDIRFVFQQTGTGWDNNEYHYLNAYSHANRATLDVDYTEPGGGGVLNLVMAPYTPV